jgi:hypothetical protein
MPRAGGLTFKLMGDTLDATEKLKLVSDRLSKLTDIPRTIKIKADDKEAQLGLDRIAVKLDKLGKRVARPSISLDGIVKANLEISALEIRMDNLSRSGGGGFLTGILRGVSGGGRGLGGLGAVTGSIAGIVAAAPVVAALAVAVAQAAAALAAATLGVGAFGLLALPTFKAVSGALAKIKNDTAAYEGATTKAARNTALKKIRDDWAALTPAQRTAVRGIQGLETEFGKLSRKLEPITLKVLNAGLAAAKPLLKDLLPFATTAGNAIAGLLTGLDKFFAPAPKVKPSGPIGSKLAPISGLPVAPTGFQNFVSQMHSLEGPAITALGNGLGKIAGAVGNLITAAAKPNSIKVLSGLLSVLAGIINGVAWAITTISGNMVKWQDIAHQTANKFDEFRHDAARVFAAVATIFDISRHTVATWGHDVAGYFDTLRHAIATIWDKMISVTIGATRTFLGNLSGVFSNGLRAIVGFFSKLPGQIGGALSSLGSELFGIGKAGLSDFLSGLKSIGGSIISWAKGFFGGLIHDIGSFLHMSPPHPGSAFFDLGANMMRHLAAGIESSAVRVRKATQGAASGFGITPSGPLQAYARKLLAAYGWSNQWGAFNDIVMRESGWNVHALNPSSGAYGIPQALPASKMASAGADWRTSGFTQLRWMMSYLKSRWGSPANADANEIRAHWYDKGGLLMPGLTLAMNATGLPEMVTPLAPANASQASGGDTYNYYVTVEGDTDPDGAALRIAQKLRKYKMRHGNAALGIG